MHKLMEYICNEMDELERKADKEGKLSAAEVQFLDTLAHTKKNLLKADEMWDESEYSNAGGSYGSYGRDGGGSYRMMGGSYARGRGRNARRDAMGRYSREGGYSRADDFRMDLQDLMQDAPNDHVRQKLQALMAEM